jgi:hypothetical protein
MQTPEQESPATRGRADTAGLLPWPLRLLVFAALVVLALVAIRVIDHHATQRAGAVQPWSAAGPVEMPVQETRP